MRRKTKILYRIFSLLLACSVIVGVFLAAPFSVSASSDSAGKKTYDIAVVFDNSGSMYVEQNKAWARAKYAMEIFASMLDYNNGDKLTVFPMWEVTTDGTTPNGQPKESSSPIEIRNKNDIDKLSKMYTIYAYGTPFTPVNKAHSYLQSSNKSEKWLIVLTDGAFDGIGENETALKNKLLPMASNNIKVQYLRFAGNSNVKSEASRGFYADSCDDKSLMTKLIGICNQIFRRDILPTKYFSGKNLKVDISMKKIIVFVQGQGANVKSLTDSSGKSVAITLDSGQRKFSDTKYATGRYSCVTDTSLYGQVVTFDSCKKGDYILDYAGSEDSIQIFYEPDVSIKVSFKNSDGVEVNGDSDDITAGEYTVTSTMVDSKTGEDVAKHELMGNDVKLNTYVKTSKDSGYKEYPNGSKITLEPDSDTDIYIEGQYLGKYKISSKEDASLKWLSNINVEEPIPPFNLDINAEQTWFVLNEHDEWKPIRISLSLEGQPLTDEQLTNTKLSLDVTKGLKYRYEMIPGESAYNVYVSQDENGKYVEPDAGKYKLTATATYTDEFGKDIKSTKNKVSFEIQPYARILRILFWIVIFLIAFLLWLAFMLQKVLPVSVIKDTASFTTMSSGELDSSFVDVEYRRKGKSLSINGSSAVDYNEQCSATFDIKAVDNRFTGAKRRRMAIIGIDSPCEEIKIAGTKYTNYDGQWIKATDLRKAEAGKEVPPIEQVISCSPRFELSRSGGLSTLTCKTKTIK